MVSQIGVTIKRRTYTANKLFRIRSRQTRQINGDVCPNFLECLFIRPEALGIRIEGILWFLTNIGAQAVPIEDAV